MKLNFRKILILGIIVAGVLALIFGVFTLLRNNSPSKSIDNISPKQSGNNINKSISENIKEIKQPERIQVLSDRAVMGIGLNKKSDRIFYYDKETGQVFRISFDSKIWERISDTEIDNLFKVIWSPTRDKAITEQRFLNQTTQKYIYNYKTGKRHSLNSKMGSVVFSPDGQRILYHYWDKTKKSNIAIANYDGSNWKTLFQSEMTGLKMYWPKEDTVAFVAPGGSFYGASLYFVKLDPPYELKEIFDGKFNLQVNWSPSGKKLLYSYKREKDSDKRNLYVRDFANETESSVNIDVEPKQCIWNKDETALYCAALTKNLLSIIPQDYQKKLSLSGDSLWKIDFSSREISEVYIPKTEEATYSISELLVSDDQAYLFFVNKLDGKLYSLTL